MINFTHYKKVQCAEEILELYESVMAFNSCSKIIEKLKQRASLDTQSEVLSVSKAP